jgi:hypothetical protein
VPPLLADLVDDAALAQVETRRPAEAFRAHLNHRGSWYAPILGPLLLPSSVIAMGVLRDLEVEAEGLEVGVVADTGIDRLGRAVATVTERGLRVRQVEAPVAKRGEDPQPGLAHLLEVAGSLPQVDAFAEAPLTTGLLAALDTITQARADGFRVAAKFRTGGLAAELFPTPVDLAAVICACRDRGLPFKLTGGLHRAIRHNDPETGIAHHGFVNILAACVVAAGGADVVAVSERLASTDAVRLIEAVRPRRSSNRPLWTGFGSRDVFDPVRDLRALGLVTRTGDADAEPA